MAMSSGSATRRPSCATRRAGPRSGRGAAWASPTQRRPRESGEEEMEIAREELEMRVLERTVQLSEANELMMLEVEERRKAERSHKEAEERYRTLVEQLPAVVYIWRPKGTLAGEKPAHPDTYTSSEIERLLGFTPAQWHSRANFCLDPMQ